MYYPIEVDERSVVLLSQGQRGFRVLESGLLCFNGETLILFKDHSRRVFSDAELGSLMPVVARNCIPECRGFDFFLISVAGD